MIVTAPIRASIVQALRSEFLYRPAVRNFLWLVADRGLRLVLLLFVGTWIARYLSAAEFGLLNYGLALISVFAAVTPLGMEGLAVREIVKNESASQILLGTVIAFRLVASLVGAILAMVMVQLLRPGETLAATVVGVLCFGLIVQSFESGELIFHARCEMNRLIPPRLGVAILISALKILLILSGMSLLWFSAATAFEQICGALVTFYLVGRKFKLAGRFEVDWNYGLRLAKQSWPLALSGLSVILYMKIAQLVIGQKLGDESLGIYAAAIRIPEVANFVPVVLASSMLPGLVRMREVGSKPYQRALLRYFRINALFAYACCLPIALFAAPITHFLYGDKYSSAASIMAAYSWTLPFVFLGIARGQHLLNEKLTFLSLAFSSLGLVLIVPLSLLFVPRFGLIGGVWATLISYGCSAFLASFFVPATRRVALLQAVALVSPWLAFRGGIPLARHNHER